MKRESIDVAKAFRELCSSLLLPLSPRQLLFKHFDKHTEQQPFNIYQMLANIKNFFPHSFHLPKFLGKDKNCSFVI